MRCKRNAAIPRVSSTGHLETVVGLQMLHLQHPGYVVGWDSPDVSAHAILSHWQCKVSIVSTKVLVVTTH